MSVDCRLLPVSRAHRTSRGKRVSSSTPTLRLIFDGFELDREGCQLFHDGVEVPVERRPWPNCAKAIGQPADVSFHQAGQCRQPGAPRRLPLQPTPSLGDVPRGLWTSVEGAGALYRRGVVAIAALGSVLRELDSRLRARARSFQRIGDPMIRRIFIGCLIGCAASACSPKDMGGDGSGGATDAAPGSADASATGGAPGGGGRASDGTGGSATVGHTQGSGGPSVSTGGAPATGGSAGPGSAMGGGSGRKRMPWVGVALWCASSAKAVCGFSAT